jgi:hypothetical protein
MVEAALPLRAQDLRRLRRGRGRHGPVVYASARCTANGRRHGLPGIRFVDRFEMKAGRITRQDVWNDMAETKAAGMTDRPDHAGRARRPDGADRRRDGRDAVPRAFNPIIAEAHDASPRDLPRRDGRDAGAGQVGPADLRGRDGLRGEGGDRQGRARATWPTATSISSTTPISAARICPTCGSCGPISTTGRALLLAGLGRPLARRGRRGARQLQPAPPRLPGGLRPAAGPLAARARCSRTSSTSCAQHPPAAIGARAT